MEENQDDIQNTSNFTVKDDERFNETAIIKVIGVGGGGGNAVNYMFKQNIPLINYVVLNTDTQALKKMSVPQKVIIGYDITRGRGAGNNPEIGRKCAESSVDEIRALFDEETEMVFITAGMGGGTGTGAAPVVARLAKEAGKLTIGIVTVPFLFEGEKKILKALDGACEMQKHVDALLVINNQNLVKIYPDYCIFNCFDKADDTLANAARSISEIISEECYINVDFQDVKSTLKDSGTAIISTAYGEGEHRISDAIHNALNSPLLKTHDIRTSKRLLLKFSCAKESKRPFAGMEINEIAQFTSTLPSSVDVKWGVADNPELEDQVKVTILASGFDITLVDDEDSPGSSTGREIHGPGTGKKIKLRADYEDNDPTDEEPESIDYVDKGKKPQNTGGIPPNITSIYGEDVTKAMELDRLKNRCMVLRPEEFDDDEIISRVEKTPTLNRDSRINGEIHELRNAQKSVSKGTNVGQNPDNTILFG